MNRVFRFVVAIALIAGVTVSTRADSWSCVTDASLPFAPVAHWSLEAECFIVPPPAGFGNKFPGEAALYMGIVHVAIYDAAVAIGGGFQSYEQNPPTAPPNTSAGAAIATAAHDVLVGLQPYLGLSEDQVSLLNNRYDDYLALLSDTADEINNGIALGEQVAATIVALRANDGRNQNPVYVNPPPGPGIYQAPDPTKVLGLRLSTIQPLALDHPWQFRPDGPNPLTSDEYAADFNQVKELGYKYSTTRTAEQTIDALFWTDHDLRQWNEGMLRLAIGRGLDLVQTARMLAMAHVSGGDAMIACFDAKFHYIFWRPIFAIPLADTDGNPATYPDPYPPYPPPYPGAWEPLRATPNFPEYPSAHACHSGAVAHALAAFFGTDKVSFSLDSRVTGTERDYERFFDVVKDVNEARVLAGFHFRNSDQQGANLGRAVAKFVTDHLFQPVN